MALCKENDHCHVDKKCEMDEIVVRVKWMKLGACKVNDTDTKDKEEDKEQKEMVYLADQARTNANPKGKTGMKYHEKKGCYNANSHIAKEEAESVGHGPCRKCLKPLDIVNV